MNAARYWLGLASTLHGAIIAWAAYTLPWRPAAPLALVLWLLALAHAASAVAALVPLARWRVVWRAQAFASLAAALILIGSIALGAERLVVLFGRLGWNLTALLAVIALLVLGLTVPMGLWGVVATRRGAPAEAATATTTPLPAAIPAATRAAGARGSAGRRWAYLVGGVTLLLVLWPLFSRKDSFPLSSYPMFSRPRGQPVLLSVIASSSGGAAWSVPSALVGSDEVLQTKVLIERAVSGGQEPMARLCAEVASRVSGKDLPPDPRSPGPGPGAAGRPEFVDIVRRRYDPVQYFVSGPRPIEEQRLHRCSIDGAPATPTKRRRRAK